LSAAGSSASSLSVTRPLSLMTIRLIFGGGEVKVVGFADGSAISRLFIICGVVMMKMTRSTKARSSSGVMFSSLQRAVRGMGGFLHNIID
jgi:hypothetical protein